MDKEQIEELHRAISKLSEEDQAQIVAAGVLTGEQCEVLKHDCNIIEVAYGGPMPIKYHLIKPTYDTEGKTEQAFGNTKSANEQ